MIYPGDNGSPVKTAIILGASVVLATLVFCFYNRYQVVPWQAGVIKLDRVTGTTWAMDVKCRWEQMPP
jgi:hypothetical protein